ncbi:hypothetical protein BCL57_002016 [Agromyces flavus]|uniref:Uncharacterized protein n=1 Tax=Agromyces flavus TaxID=589382 RepID=A0A1H1PUH3_9MICO|nr:hypothetical protein [Agromyces flavus]MCP2367857.1 hypothetical protein [Agromyces flavus]GGI47317.1 hypothetical protein GCM10010932_20050 [Agromyces flavus]SDS14902.1 hypothetical protein SAMN04489721_0849 [Agromyces flavus]
MADEKWLPWLVSTIVVAALAGCSAGSVAETTSPSQPEESTAPPFEPTPDANPLPDVLTFEAGADLDPAVWIAGWHVVPADMAHGYAVVHQRDDWEEVHLDDQGCVSTRSHQFGSLDGLDLSLDDRALSDQYFSQVVGIPAEAIAENGSDVPYPVVGRDMTIEFRVLGGSRSDGGAWLAAARVLGALDTAMIIRLECEPGGMTGASSQDLFDHLAEVAGPDGSVVGIGRADWNVVDTLDFDAGDELIETSAAAWVDGALTTDPSWTLDEGAGNDGSWQYRANDGDCLVDFEQNLLTPETRASGEDRTASDELLAVWLDLPFEEVTDAAEDGGIALGVPGNDLAGARLYEEADGRGGTVTAARALVQPGFGFIISVECRKADPRGVLEQVIAKSALQVVP